MAATPPVGGLGFGLRAYDGVVRDPGVGDDEVLLDALQRGGEVDPLPDVRAGRPVEKLKQPHPGSY